MANLQAGKEETALGLKREWLHAASSPSTETMCGATTSCSTEQRTDGS